ncbi:unnamed protein product [Diplocarpon coronariae]|uniref:DUF7918 domain-containing protein n=1 Tax=Diplocarpon coronariae TaxID=2795749 RepID=A0A218Z533_9HELO|nr:hypothetical protein JHW43_008547 [Diplocarpon mali]OWP02326.1 hypothetical protein B2J93_1288 [Marssonina coronariae]
MAILEPSPGLEATVCVEDTPAKEYSDDEVSQFLSGNSGEWQSALTVSKYIESVSEKQFHAELEIHEAFNFGWPNLSYRLFVDGKRVRIAPLAHDNVIPVSRLTA